MKSPHTIFFDKHSHLLLPAILLLALIIRIWALLSLKESIYFDYLLWDERVYHTWAEKLANGTYSSKSVYEMAPFPAYLMALIYRVFSPDIIYIRIFNIVLGSITCLIVYLTGKCLANRMTGIIVCLVACLYKPFIFYSIVPLKTALSVFLFALVIYMLMATIQRPAKLKIILMGAFIGLMLNVRPNSLVLIPALPLIILWTMDRQKLSAKSIFMVLAFYFVGLFLAVGPFVIRNYIVADKVTLTASQSGINLYIANNLENKDPYYRPVHFASSNPFWQGTQFNIEASRRAGRKLSPVEASEYWNGEVLKIALERPAHLFWKLSQKSLALLNRFEAGDHYHIGFISDFVKILKLPFFTLPVILPLGIATLILNIFRSKEFFSLSAIFLLYSLTLVIFFPTSRFRLPLLIILIPFAVYGIMGLISYMKARQFKKAGVYAVIVVLFIIIGYLPIRGTDDLSAYYNTHAVILNSNGLEYKALSYWKQSSSMNKPYSAFADLSLAGIYLINNDIQNASFYLDKIPDNSFAASDKYEIIGDIMMIRNQSDKAIDAYERSLEINSGRISVRKKLISIFVKKDRKRALEEYKMLEYISSFYDQYSS